MTKRKGSKDIGPVVQLVRIPACHLPSKQTVTGSNPVAITRESKSNTFHVLDFSFFERLKFTSKGSGNEKYRNSVSGDLFFDLGEARMDD